MPNPFKRRRSFFDNFFPDLGDFDKFDEMIEEMMKEHFRDFDARNLRSGKPVVYGFSMRVDEDGKPVIQEFGNVQKGKVKGEREPLVDVIDGEKEVTVIAELPGVEKQYLHISTTKNEFSINVTDPNRRFAKKIALPCSVDEKSARAKLKNGILEVVLTKKHPSKKTSEIKIE